jgi:hypothetical protein
MLRRSLILIESFVLSLALFPQPSASAVSPTREPLVFPSELDLAAGDFCAFPVIITFPVNREFATIFYDAEGNVDHVLITGSLMITATNADTGESVNLNIPGSSVTVDDLITYRGLNVIFPVEGTLDFVAGRVVVTVDSAGFQQPVTVAGLTVDICALLAP